MDVFIVTAARQVLDFGTANLLLLCELERGEPVLIALEPNVLIAVEDILADERRTAETKGQALKTEERPRHDST